MKVVRKSSEEEMIAVFLKSELSSTRFSGKLKKILKKVNVSEKLINRYTLSDENENKTRKEILAQYRGYGLNKHIFENFPQNVDWNLVELNANDIKKIKYIDYDYWVELTNGSRLAYDATENIKNNIKIFEVSNEGFIRAAEYFRDGGKFEPMILVAAENTSDMIVLEGHLRLTAMNLELGSVTTIHAILGYAKRRELDKWYRY